MGRFFVSSITLFFYFLAEGHVSCLSCPSKPETKNGCPTIMVGAAVCVAGVSSFLQVILGQLSALHSGTLSRPFWLDGRKNSSQPDRLARSNAPCVSPQLCSAYCFAAASEGASMLNSPANSKTTGMLHLLMFVIRASSHAATGSSFVAETSS